MSRQVVLRDVLSAQGVALGFFNRTAVVPNLKKPETPGLMVCRLREQYGTLPLHAKTTRYPIMVSHGNYLQLSRERLLWRHVLDHDVMLGISPLEAITNSFVGLTLSLMGVSGALFMSGTSSSRFFVVSGLFS